MLALTACHRQMDEMPGISVQTEITPRPVVVGTSTVTVRLLGADGGPLPGAKIMVEGDMSHPGMAPVFAAAKESPDGRYVAPIEFSMAGDWVVALHIKLLSGQTLERQIDVKNVESN